MSFESPRVHTNSYKFVGTFSCSQIDLRKARERELTTLTGMKNRRAVGLLNPMRNLRQEPGGIRDDTCDHGLFRSWKVEVCKDTYILYIYSEYIIKIKNTPSSTSKYIIETKIHYSCEIEDFVETHLCKLCVILRSRALRVVCPH